KSHPMKLSDLTAARFAAIFVGSAALLLGQTAVLDINYGKKVNGPKTSSGGIQYMGRYQPVESIGTADGEYRFDGPAAQGINVRRGTGGPNFTTVLYQMHDNGRALGTHEPDIEQLFLSNNLYQGLRNPFANGT